MSLIPLHSGGLWEAVIPMPPASPWCRTAQERSGVGSGAAASRTGMPRAASTPAASAAKRSERSRRSQATATPRAAVPSASRYAPMAADTRRTLAKVKSRAMTPRQPSVPKRMVMGSRYG